MIALTNAKKQSPVRSLPEQASVFFFLDGIFMQF